MEDQLNDNRREAVMSSVVDLTDTLPNSSTPLLEHRQREKPSKNYCRDGCRGIACFPEEPSYELVENFPCLFKPFDYFLRERFPFVQWLIRYRPRMFISDVIAGLTVGLMVVPQALAYASIAGLPLQYGLYSSFMGVFVYTFFGTSKDVTLGPTAILSLLTASVINSNANENNLEANVPMAVLLTLLSGLIQFTLGILNLGFLIEFIPLPVISGFTSAAAITIAMGQVQHLLGIHGTNITVRRPFIYCLYDTARYITHWKPGDFVLGICCILLVLFLRYFKVHNESYQRNHPEMSWPQVIAHKFLWILCTGRNAVVVLVAGLIGFALVKYIPDTNNLPITLVDYKSEGQLPSFHAPNVTVHNIKKLGVGVIVAPLIGFLESIAIGKAFARQNKYSINPTQELIAIGLSNVASCFVGSYPVTGSFSRTAVNSQSGVKTPAAGIFTGGVVLLAVSVLSNGFDYIPKTALSAIIIAAVLYMFISSLFNLELEDLTLIVSFLGTLLLGIQYGVPLATILSLVIILYRHSRTRHQVVVHGQVLQVSFNGGWTYPGMEYVWKRIRQELKDFSLSQVESQPITAVVFNCSAMPDIDYTIIQGLREGCLELHEKAISVILVEVQPHIVSVIEKAKIDNLRLSPSLDTAIQMVEERVRSSGHQSVLDLTTVSLQH